MKLPILGDLKEIQYKASSALRSSQFLSQSLLTSVALRRFPLPETKHAKIPPPWVGLRRLAALVEKDWINIKKGYYLEPEQLIENPIEFSKKFLKTAMDLIDVKRRIDKKEVKVFDENQRPPDLPAYFTQNFHYQSDGYLSDHSASLYDHQVETVFVGGGQLMRRQALVPIYHWCGGDREKSFKFLDIACGTGVFTAEVARNFPKAQVQGVDASSWYIKKAKREQGGIDFSFALAEKLPFEDNSFDVITNIFLFHELPENIRLKVIAEFKRVLKPGGLLVHIDSMQWDDDPELNGSLELFPKLYHEPFYFSYVRGPKLEALLEEKGFAQVQAELAFYSKVVSARA